MRIPVLSRRSAGAGLLMAALAAATAGPAHATPSAAMTILFCGDSLPQGLFLHTAPALRRIPGLRLVNATRHATGLARSDEHDWTTAVAEAVARHAPDLTIMWIGANDFRPFVDRAARARYSFGTPGFDAAYGAKVASIAAHPGLDGRRLVWIGLPNMRDRSFAGAAQRLNSIFEETLRNAGPGRHFADIWTPTSDTDGSYRVGVFGADLVERRLRAEDGVHFSEIGYRAIAHLVLRDLADAEEELAEPLHPVVTALDPGIVLS